MKIRTRHTLRVTNQKTRSCRPTKLWPVCCGRGYSNYLISTNKAFCLTAIDGTPRIVKMLTLAARLVGKRSKPRSCRPKPGLACETREIDGESKNISRPLSHSREYHEQNYAHVPQAQAKGAGCAVQNLTEARLTPHNPPSSGQTDVLTCKPPRSARPMIHSIFSKNRSRGETTEYAVSKPTTSH